MSKRLLYSLKWLLVLGLILPLLAACGQSVKDTYPLESVTKNGNQTSYVYRAANQTVPEVAKQIADNRKPDQTSKEDPERMFLVYSDELVHVQKDTAKPTDTLIEVDSNEYVRNNYASDFLQGYITASIIGHLFGSFGGGYGGYRGYTSRDVYKPVTEYHAPTEQEKKATPPMTVNKTGSITKRNSSSASNDTSAGGNGNVFTKDTNAGSTGTITRNDSSSSSGSGNGSLTSKSKPGSVSPPKTKSGSGTITKRK
jgi:hypothetical protein